MYGVVSCRQLAHSNIRVNYYIFEGKNAMLSIFKQISYKNTLHLSTCSCWVTECGSVIRAC